jgi:hypothetical protein
MEPKRLSALAPLKKKRQEPVGKCYLLAWMGLQLEGGLSTLALYVLDILHRGWNKEELHGRGARPEYL